MTRIGFHGAAETVTGSRHLLETGGKRILVDCGMFQGAREIRERNWHSFPVQPSDLDIVLVTHAHLDHIGWLPRLVAQGYKGPILATKATIKLAQISLPDSARLQEEDARHANRHALSRHKPALPLYTEKEAYAALKCFEAVPYEKMIPLPGKAIFRFRFAGHILGSAFAEIYFENGERILMSGDLGRRDSPIINDPTAVDGAEYLVLESTYGDRLHGTERPMDELEQVMKQTIEQGGCVLVPSFAIGRTQELLYYISLLQESGRAPRLPIFLDSPMASSVTEVYASVKEEHDGEMRLALESGLRRLEPSGVTWVRDKEQSKVLNDRKGPMMVISGSGMATGGRIVHHLKNRLSDPSTTVMFTGYQAEGTLGRQLLEGAKEVTVQGQTVQVQTKVCKINSLSAHADQGEIMQWLGNFQRPPKRTFLVHGEPRAQAALSARIKEDLGWEVVIPKHGQRFDLG